MSSYILLSDLHLTDNPDDEYRWKVFPFLRDKISALGLELKVLFILGDLCQNKDRHSAVLVNRVVENIVGLYRAGLNRIVILTGNHDGVGGAAYFEFLKWFPYITMVTKPCIEQIGLSSIALLPHTKTPEQDWKSIHFRGLHYVFAHATVKGAKSETGYALPGEGGILESLTRMKLGITAGPSRVWSGDVHVPQKIGQLEYVGAPYPIRFGDSYKGRIVLLDNHKQTDWHMPTIKKASVSISDVSELDKAWLKAGDQLKVELVLPREDRHAWHQQRDKIAAWCQQKGVGLYGVELQGQPRVGLNLKSREAIVAPTLVHPDQALSSYIKKTPASRPAEEVGLRLLRKAQDGR